MRKIKNYLMLVLCVALVLSILSSIPAQAASIRPFAWPGRPGGTGTGSEEWLQGNYGETNGPWLFSSQHKGTTADLNGTQDKLKSLASTALGILVEKVGIPLGRFLTAAGLAESLWGKGYEGAYYDMKVYYSGRCAKIEIRTYKNSNYTGFVKLYTEYIKW